MTDLPTLKSLPLPLPAHALKELDRDEEVEAFALQLYDEFNQHPFDQISVSKAQCIKMARERLKRAKQWSKPVKD